MACAGESVRQRTQKAAGASNLKVAHASPLARPAIRLDLIRQLAPDGFLQGLEYLSGTYGWPRQIQQLTTLALLIGLPIVLELAWYHGDRGQQRISSPEFAILTLLLLLGGGAFWYCSKHSVLAEAARILIAIDSRRVITRTRSRPRWFGVAGYRPPPA